MWNFAHYKHCDVLDKFKQMLEDNFCILYGKMGKRKLEKAIGEYSVKNMKKRKKTLKKINIKGALLVLH